MRNGIDVIQVILIALIGAGVYGCKKQEPEIWEKQLYTMTKIAFTSEGNIMVMNADGSGRENVKSKYPAAASRPFWSPDGRRIAFNSVKDGNMEIYIVNADGTEQRNLTNNPAHDGYISWSPDSKRILFSSDRDRTNKMDSYFNSDIYVMNADGTEQKNLTNNPSFYGSPSWSTDGKKIVFVSSQNVTSTLDFVMEQANFKNRKDVNFEIYVMNSDGSELKNLTNNPAYERYLSCSPDGKKVAFSTNRDGNFEIYVVNIDGSEQRNLTKNPAWDRTPSWFPDGTKIAFVSDRDGNFDIYSMNPDGSEQKNLTKNPASDGADHCLSWSPDGKKIAFTSTRDRSGEIYIMNADGSDQKNLTNDDSAYDGNPSWSPFLPSEEKE